MGAFAAPNRAGVMNSLPPEHRGVGAGMTSTFQNSGQVLSIGIFFTLVIIGLSSTLPATLYHGLVAHGVPVSVATRVAHLPAVSDLFAAFLGYNPVQHLVGTAVLAHLPAGQAAILTGHGYFPSLISAPFADGLHAAFDFSIGVCLVAAGTSWLRGGKYHYTEEAEPTGSEPTVAGPTAARPTGAAPAAVGSAGLVGVPADPQDEESE
jgi:hypothetical protein